MNLVIAAPADAVARWAEIEPHMVTAASWRGSLADIRGWVERGLWQLFLAIDDDGRIKAVMAAEMIAYPGAKAARLVACCGRERESWQDAMPMVERWARAIGCDHIEAWARPGWSRVLARFGWRMRHVIVEKEL